jgi:GAF domain-containing protein
VVLQVGTTLASSLDVEEVTQTIARQVGEALDVQWCDINEFDPEAGTFTYVAVWAQELRAEDTDYVGTVVSLEDRPERDAVLRRGDLLEAYLDDPALDPREREVMLEYDERAVMEVPLVFQGETLGVLGVVESRRDRRFNDSEKELLRLLAGPAATALGNARLYRRQQEQARRLATLLDASAALAASVDLDEVLARVARLAAEAVEARYATVYEYRPHHDALVYRAEYTTSRSSSEAIDDALGTAYALGDHPGERAILEAPGAVQEDISDADLAADRRRVMELWRQQTCLSLPLRSGGATQGTLRLTTTDAERRFTPYELELLEALAEVAGAAIHNARLFRVLEEESDQLLELLDVSHQLTSTFERSAVVTTLQEGSERLLVGNARAQVWLRCAGGGLCLAAGEGGPEAPALAREALFRSRIVDFVGRERSGLAVPLAVMDAPEGALVIEVQGHRTFTSGELEALQVLANQAAAALENERLYRRAEREAIRDGLTGLYNHRHFQERLRQECRRAERYGTPLSLLILDLDAFKSFNDQFGHQTGDEALREVGQILFAVTRRGVDLAARYGGEEFAVILPHTRAADAPPEGEQGAAAGADAPPPAGAGALVVARRVQDAISSHVFPGHGGRRHARTTVTIGVAELRPGEDASALLAAADAALYQGKRAGRDRVVKRGD